MGNAFKCFVVLVRIVLDSVILVGRSQSELPVKIFEKEMGRERKGKGMPPKHGSLRDTSMVTSETSCILAIPYMFGAWILENGHGKDLQKSLMDKITNTVSQTKSSMSK